MVRNNLLKIALFVLVTETGFGQSVVKVRGLARPDAVSTAHFGFILNVRELSNGKLIVNDGKARQLLLLNNQLGLQTILLDSAAEGAQRYGAMAAPIIAYTGDSTFFVEGSSSSLLLFDPNGRMVRVVAPPKAKDIDRIASAPSTVDANGNLIYLAYPGGRMSQLASGVQGTLLLSVDDSSSVLRANFDRRTIDTVGRLYTPLGIRARLESINGQIHNIFTFNPLVRRDDWAVFSNGAIGFVRAHDYHVDVLFADGTWHVGPKLPFDFKRVTDDEKRALIDSTRAAHAKEDAAARKTVAAGKAVAADSALRRPPGTTLVRTSPAQLSPQRSVSEEFVPLDSMADYWPPLRAGAVKPDLDQHLWILPTTSAQSLAGELVYDVVDDHGELLYRVRLPLGRSIAGFGRDGTVYLMTREAAGWILERSRLLP